MTPSVEDILGLMVVLMILAGFSGTVAFGVARVVARQQIAENVLRERLTRAWGVNRTSGESETR